MIRATAPAHHHLENGKCRQRQQGNHQKVGKPGTETERMRQPSEAQARRQAAEHGAPGLPGRRSSGRGTCGRRFSSRCIGGALSGRAWRGRRGRCLALGHVARLLAHRFATAQALGFGIGMTIESSRVRLRPDGPVWKRVVRYGLGMAVALIIRAGLGSVFPAEPEWIVLPLRFLGHLILLLWISLYAPWTFVRLRLASADPESEVHITFDTPLS